MSTKSASIFWLGLDVHKDSITAAVFCGGASAPRSVDRLSSDLTKLRRYLFRLLEQGEVRACYEASGAGYVLHRQLTEWGIHCEVIAPSLTPVRPGDRRKHDKRDALSLAKHYRAGELTAVHVPTEAEERVRDLVRCREAFQREILASRHYVLKFLIRRGHIYTAGSHWTQRHRAWLERLLHDEDVPALDRQVLGEYLALLDYKIDRRAELDRQIEEIAFGEPYRTALGYIRCFRGLDTLAAMTLLTEIGDWRRFATAGQLMAYLGLVPSEHSSGDRFHRGPITKSGNSRCRHVLVQAAWHYRHRPAVGRVLQRRQRGQPPHVVAHAWKAQHRLFKTYHRLAHRRPSTQIAAVAVARELVGFLWGVLHDLDPAIPMNRGHAA